MRNESHIFGQYRESADIVQLHFSALDVEWGDYKRGLQSVIWSSRLFHHWAPSYLPQLASHLYRHMELDHKHFLGNWQLAFHLYTLLYKTRHGRFQGNKSHSTDLKAHSCVDGLLVIVTCATWEILASASPRNPNDWIQQRSSNFCILLVVNRSHTIFKSSRWIPLPLSWIWISLMPPWLIVMLILVAPASILFSRSSFTAFSGRWITSPAAIRFTTWALRRSIRRIIKGSISNRERQQRWRYRELCLLDKYGRDAFLVAIDDYSVQSQQMNHSVV